MSLYAIGDLHLSLGTEKPMDVFGGRWLNYVEKITDGFMALHDDDLTVICGDITWGMTMDEALPDFLFIDKLPGKKIILKGNHDYWWTTATKAGNFFREHGIESIDILHNNSFSYGGVSICGTRGWCLEDNAPQDKKVSAREEGRLKASLEAASGSGLEPVVFMHYPPVFNQAISGEMIDVMLQYGVKRCFYGHLHGPACSLALEGEYLGINFSLVSADYLNFSLKRL